MLSVKDFERSRSRVIMASEPDCHKHSEVQTCVKWWLNEYTKWGIEKVIESCIIYYNTSETKFKHIN